MTMEHIFISLRNKVVYMKSVVECSYIKSSSHSWWKNTDVRWNQTCTFLNLSVPARNPLGMRLTLEFEKGNPYHVKCNLRRYRIKNSSLFSDPFINSVFTEFIHNFPYMFLFKKLQCCDWSIGNPSGFCPGFNLVSWYAATFCLF